MAWLGLAAVIGLIVCGLTALYDIHRGRKERKLPPGASLPSTWWTGQRLALVSFGVVALVIGAIVGVIELFPGSGGNAKITATSTPTTASSDTTTTVSPTRPPQQVHVEVLNGSGTPKAATTRAAALAAAGYAIAGTGNAPIRRGTVVECKPGFDAESVALARAVGGGTAVQPFPTPAPTGSANASCVVVLGR